MGVEVPIDEVWVGIGSITCNSEFHWNDVASNVGINSRIIGEVAVKLNRVGFVIEIEKLHGEHALGIRCDVSGAIDAAIVILRIIARSQRGRRG